MSQPSEPNLSQHTPGPWRAVDGGVAVLNDALHDYPSHVKRTYEDEEGRRCHQFIADCNTRVREHKANARLIAAAPDMLAALKAFFDKWPEVERVVNGYIGLQFARTKQQYDGPNIAEELDAMRAAIAKVEQG